MDELSGLPEAVRKVALERFRLLQPHFEQNRPLRSVADEAGIPYRTGQRWVARYQQFGLGALTRKRRADSGGHRVISARFRKIIEGLALQKPPLPISALARQARLLAKDSDEPAPKYWVIYDIVRQLPADLLTLAHQGTKAYSETFDLVDRREASGPNAIWQGDHLHSTFYLSVRTVHRRNRGSQLSWMITAAPWLDISLSFEAPSTLHTSVALRQGIWRKADPRWNVCGIPDVLYTDHGSDFTSRHLEQVGANLKIRLIFSMPGKPRGRGRIERFFSTVNELKAGIYPSTAALAPCPARLILVM